MERRSKQKRTDVFVKENFSSHESLEKNQEQGNKETFSMDQSTKTFPDKTMNQTELFSPIHHFAFDQVEATSMLLFRVFFGVVLLYEASTFVAGNFYKLNYYANQTLQFPIWGFGEIGHLHKTLQLISGGWVLKIEGILMVLTGFGVMIGKQYKICLAIYAILFGICFGIDQTTYLNHHYLILIICVLLLLMEDIGQERLLQNFYISQYNLTVLRMTVLIVYFYAGFVKLNWDWLHGEPLTHWMIKRNLFSFDSFSHYQILGLFLSWSGILLDLMIAPFQIWGQMRPISFLFLGTFHALNKLLFDLGSFPGLMLSTFILFIEPQTPGKIYYFLRGEKQSYNKFPHKRSTGTFSHKQSLHLLILTACLLFQIAIPLRGYVYATGDINWTEEGYLLSWKMMLNDKEGSSIFSIVDPRTGEVKEKIRTIDLFSDIVVLLNAPSCRPQILLQTAHRLGDDFEKKNGFRPHISCTAYCSLNYRIHQLLFDPHLDLLSIDLAQYAHPWVYPRLGPAVRGHPWQLDLEAYLDWVGIQNETLFRQRRGMWMLEEHLK